MSVLVTSADSIKALITTRSLSKKGLKVFTAEDHQPSLASSSKYSYKCFQYSSPQISEEIFIENIIDIIKENNIDVLIPVHSRDTYILSKYKNIINKHVSAVLPEYEKLKQLNDKGTLMKIASDYDIKIPKTYYFEDYKNIENISKELHYPVVIKKRISTRSEGVSYAHNEKDFQIKYNKLLNKDIELSEYPIIQEYISGEAYGVSLLYNNGENIAQFVHKRIREYPITGGPSTYRLSVKNKKLVNISKYLLDEMNWHGFAMFEYKVDHKNNTPYLIEVNPRLVGSLNQAISSGVDFPWLIYNIALGKKIKPITCYLLGIKTKNFFTDTISVLAIFQKTGKIIDYNPFNPQIKDDILSIRDPIPILRFLFLGLRDLKISHYDNNFKKIQNKHSFLKWCF